MFFEKTLSDLCCFLVNSRILEICSFFVLKLIKPDYYFLYLCIYDIKPEIKEYFIIYDYQQEMRSSRAAFLEPGGPGRPSIINNFS